MSFPLYYSTASSKLIQSGPFYKVIRDGTGNITGTERVYQYEDAAGNGFSPFDADHKNTKYVTDLVNPGSNVTVWGDATMGGDTSIDLTNVIAICSTDSAFAALKSNGSVVTWGNSLMGGDSSSVSAQLQNDVVAIYSNQGAFAALKGDSTVVIWGEPSYGGQYFDQELNPLTGIVDIYSTETSFLAVKEGGAAIIWGMIGGSVPTLTNIKAVYSNAVGYTIITDTDLITFGGGGYDYNTPTNDSTLDNTVVAVYSTGHAFAALKKSGDVVTWGNTFTGGDSLIVSSDLTDVKEIYSTNAAFAALKNSGDVVVWGDVAYGGQFQNSSYTLVGQDIAVIYSNAYSFAAVSYSGSVVTWGDNSRGGNSSSVSSSLTSGVNEIYATNDAFAALKSDGSVVTWGAAPNGGDSTNTVVSANISGGVTNIYSNDFVFVATKDDNSMVVWGSYPYGADLGMLNGGTSTEEGAHLYTFTDQVVAVYSTRGAFAALTISTSGGNVPCFMKGTPVLTTKGYTNVEKLTDSDMLVLSDSRIVPIKNIYKTVVKKTTELNAPICIKKNAYGKNTPSKDTWVSPIHAFSLKPGVWKIPIREINVNKRVYQNYLNSKVVYYHIETDNYLEDNVIVNGLCMETFGIPLRNKGYKVQFVYNKEKDGYIRNVVVNKRTYSK